MCIRDRGKQNYPALAMTQYSAIQFCKWLYARTGVFYRLPTEAEWEYACRAGSTTEFSFGDEETKLGEYAWYKLNSNKKTQPVGLKKPNAWGLYDMYGNVAEWTYDQYNANFHATSVNSVSYTHLNVYKRQVLVVLALTYLVVLVVFTHKNIPILQI